MKIALSFHSRAPRCAAPALVVLALFLAVVCEAPARAGPDPREAAIDRAIEKGTDYLLKQIQAQQVGKNGFGQVALETYALVVAGISVDHPIIRNNFLFLRKRMRGSLHVYSLSCYVFALDAAISQLEFDHRLLNPTLDPKRLPSLGNEYRSEMRAAVAGLLKTQNGHGAWRYFQNSDFDNSNTQFAVLGLGVGAKRGISIPTSAWLDVVRHFKNGQDKSGAETADRVTLESEKERQRERDALRLVKENQGKSRRGSKGKDKERDKGSGRTTVRKPTSRTDPVEDPVVGAEDIVVRRRGWSYENKGAATWNMTCAGLSSMVLARDNLKGEIDSRDWKELLQSVYDGYGWVMGNWKATESYYGMYSLEKVADLGYVKTFANRDWYRELSDFILRRQSGAGAWTGTGQHGETDRVATSFALLILRRATSLVTRDPADQIMISGRRSDPTVEDRTWVYIPELDTQLHFPTILKTIRTRPMPKLVEFLEQIIENYPPEWRGELVPQLVTVRERASKRTVQRILDRQLELAAGTEFDHPDEYLKWHERWARIGDIVKARQKKLIPELMKIYKNELDSVSLKQAAARALVRLKIRSAMPLFVTDLEHTKALIRFEAYRSIKAFYVDTPPDFDPEGDESVRNRQIGSIKKWIRAQEKRRRAARSKKK